jgi:hypothetical protein
MTYVGLGAKNPKQFLPDDQPGGKMLSMRVDPLNIEPLWACIPTWVVRCA